MAGVGAAFLVAACSQNSVPTPGAAASQREEASTRMMPSKAAQYLFVGNEPNTGAGSVTMYDASQNKLVTSITEGVEQPSAIDIGTDGYLYVANEDNHGTIGVYNAKLKLLRAPKSAERPSKMVFDSNNNLYVEGFDFVAGLPGGQSPKYRIRPSGGIAVDASGVLYVASTKLISAYEPGAKKPFKSISVSPNGTIQLTIDANGNMYAAFYGKTGCGQVVVYDLSTDSLEYTLDSSSGICHPEQVSIGPDGNVYVLNYDEQKSNILVYPVGQTMALRTISQGLGASNDFTFDAAGNLYVSNYTNVTVYGPGRGSVLRTITNGVDSATSLAFGQLK
jgi:hypothetical protein